MKIGEIWNRIGTSLDLSLLAPFRDLLLILGFIAVINGVALLSIPAAWILAGGGAMGASYLMARK